MNTRTTSRIDTNHALALLDRLDPSWRETCTVEGCAHHRHEAARTSTSDRPLPHRSQRRISQSKAA